MTHSVEIPNYYSIITADVRYDKRLNDSHKVLFSEITALTNATGECWASNEYLANLYGVSISTISRRISDLKKYGYITVELRYKKGTKEIDKRILKLAHTYTQNCVGGIGKSVQDPIRKIAQENTTSKSNNTSINNISELFNEFYDLYPKKVNKTKAKKTFDKVVTNEDIFKAIMNDLKKRKRYPNWIKDDGQFIPHPTSYLNGQRWLDEYKTEGVDDYEEDGLIPVGTIL